MRYSLLILSLSGCFAPTSGTWTTSAGDVTSSTCAERDENPVRAGVSLTLQPIDKGAFRLRLTGTPAYGCSLQGKDFTCGTKHEDINASDDGEAVLHRATSIYGSFLDPSSLYAYRKTEVTCEGETCADVADAQARTFPCEATASFGATFTDSAIDQGDTDAAPAPDTGE